MAGKKKAPTKAVTKKNTQTSADKLAGTNKYVLCSY